MSQEGQITIFGQGCNGARITRCSADQYSCALRLIAFRVQPLKWKAVRWSEYGGQADHKLDQRRTRAAPVKSGGDPGWIVVSSRHCVPWRIPNGNSQAAIQQVPQAVAVSRTAPPERGETHGLPSRTPRRFGLYLHQSKPARLVQNREMRALRLSCAAQPPRALPASRRSPLRTPYPAEPRARLGVE